MNPSWLVMAGGSSLSASLPQRKVKVLPAAGLTASAGFAAAAGAVVGAAAAGAAVAAAGFAASAGLAASVGLAAAGALVGCAAGGAAGAGGWLPHAVSRPIPNVAPASCRKLRRLTGDDRMVPSLLAKPEPLRPRTSGAAGG